MNRTALLMAALGLQLEHRRVVVEADQIEHRSMCHWCGEFFDVATKPGRPTIYCPGATCGEDAKSARKRAHYAEHKDELKVRRVLREEAA